MTTIYVNWGEAKVKLTWERSNQFPPKELITSVHGFCFHENKLLLVNVNHRGWDIPGGHIELNETPEACFKREAKEEGYVEGECSLLGYMIVDHSENQEWKECSPYPRVGYQVFYRFEINRIHRFEAEYEVVERIFINPDEISDYYHDWHDIYQEILNCAMNLGVEDA